MDGWQNPGGDMPEEERLRQLRAIEEERHSAARNRWSLLQVPRVGPQTEEMMSAAEAEREGERQRDRVIPTW